MPYIYSTASADTAFKIRDEQHQVIETIFVAGKANIANKHMLTSQGVSTEVSDEQLKKLESIPVFRQQVANGFLKVDSKRNADKVAKEMAPKDKSAPATKDDFKQSVDGEVVEVKTGNKK